MFFIFILQHLYGIIHSHNTPVPNFILHLPVFELFLFISNLPVYFDTDFIRNL